MILLSGHSLTPASKIPIESMSLRLRERDSAAVITMAGADLHGIAINSWMRDDNGMVWRVRSIQHKYADSTVEIQLEHVILALKDLILFGEITPATITANASATTCTALQAITYILAQHPDWTLGTYGYGTVTNAYKFDGDNLYDALERVCNTLDDPWWTLNTAVYPFQISIAPKQSGVACELRPDRNLSAITKTVDMSGCYTRFYPIGKGDLHITGGYVSKNESTYGVIARVETDQSLETEAELIAWANERLGKHAEPEVTVRAQGLDLAEATGEPLDQLTLGRICRVPLPEYNTTILDRITELYYPDLLRSPESVEITMANRTEDITRIIANEIKTGGGRGGSGGRRAARVEGMVEEFDNSDIWINRDAIWAVSGAYTVVTDAQGNKHIRLNDGSLLEVMRDGVYETVGTSQAIAEVDDVVTNTILGSALWTQRTNITGVVGEFDVVGSGANRRLVIKSGGGLKIERNNVEYGVYDSGNLDAGVIVEKLSNGTTTTKIKSDYITLDGEAVADSLLNEELYINNKLDVGGAFSFQTEDVAWCSFSINGTEVAMFLGTADVNFDRAAAQRQGVNSVYISPSDIIISDGPDYSLNGGAPYYDVEIEASTTSTLFPSLSDTATQSIRVSATEAYADGVLAGEAEFTATTVHVLGPAVWVVPVGTSHTVTPIGTSHTLYPVGDYKSGYKRGTAHTNALTGYTTFNDGDPIQLFSYSNGSYHPEGRAVWRKGGTVSTLYESGDQYGLYERGSAVTYYEAGTAVTYYEAGTGADYYTDGGAQTYYVKST